MDNTRVADIRQENPDHLQGGGAIAASMSVTNKLSTTANPRSYKTMPELPASDPMQRMYDEAFSNDPEPAAPGSLLALLAEAAGRLDYLRPDDFDDDEHRDNFDAFVAKLRSAAGQNLYHVIAADGELTPHADDLFVWEATPERAVAEWQRYYDRDDDELPESVDEIPLTGTAGPIPWSGPGSVPCVWVSPEKGN